MWQVVEVSDRTAIKLAAQVKLELCFMTGTGVMNALMLSYIK